MQVHRIECTWVLTCSVFFQVYVFECGDVPAKRSSVPPDILIDLIPDTLFLTCPSVFMLTPEHRSQLAAESSLKRQKRNTSECQNYMLTKLKHIIRAMTG